MGCYFQHHQKVLFQMSTQRSSLFLGGLAVVGLGHLLLTKGSESVRFYVPLRMPVRWRRKWFLPSERREPGLIAL